MAKPPSAECRDLNGSCWSRPPVAWSILILRVLILILLGLRHGGAWLVACEGGDAEERGDALCLGIQVVALGAA